MNGAGELIQETSDTGLAIPVTAGMRAQQRRRVTRRSIGRHWPALFGGGVLLIMITCAIIAPWIAPYDPSHQSLLDSLIPPFWQSGGSFVHPLGTDQLGQDILSRLIYGSRISLIIGFSTVAISGTIGVILGLVSGYFGRVIDALIMRFVEIQLAFPFILLALLVMALFGQGLRNLIIVLSLTGWATYARVIRAETMAALERPYVEAARTLGSSNARIIIRHILPNVFAPVIVIATFSVALMIIQEAALSFLGLGVPPNVPSWGGMLADGRNYLTVAWWMGTLPGIAILFVVLGINLLGDWLRDMLDPSTRNA
jgi:peptide/nickel transport system permease protein